MNPIKSVFKLARQTTKAGIAGTIAFAKTMSEDAVMPLGQMNAIMMELVKTTNFEELTPVQRGLWFTAYTAAVVAMVSVVSDDEYEEAKQSAKEQLVWVRKEFDIPVDFTAAYNNDVDSFRDAVISLKDGRRIGANMNKQLKALGWGYGVDHLKFQVAAMARQPERFIDLLELNVATRFGGLEEEKTSSGSETSSGELSDEMNGVSNFTAA